MEGLEGLLRLGRDCTVRLLHLPEMGGFSRDRAEGRWMLEVSKASVGTGGCFLARVTSERSRPQKKKHVWGIFVLLLTLVPGLLCPRVRSPSMGGRGGDKGAFPKVGPAGREEDGHQSRQANRAGRRGASHPLPCYPDICPARTPPVGVNPCGWRIHLSSLRGGGPGPAARAAWPHACPGRAAS